MARLVLFDFVGQRRARPDQAHLAANHVDELRQLIDTEAAQPAPDGRDALVPIELEYRLAVLSWTRRAGAGANPLADELPMHQVIGFGPHGAELEHLERTAVEPD